MSYQPARTHSPFALILRGAGSLLRHWKLALIAAFFLSPVGPHLRLDYDYTARRADGTPVTTRCGYVGARGMIEVFSYRCPVIAWLDAREFD